MMAEVDCSGSSLCSWERLFRRAATSPATGQCRRGSSQVPFPSPFDAHEKRRAVLEFGVAHHLIEAGRIRHGFAHLLHNLEMPRQRLDRHILGLLNRPTTLDPCAYKPGHVLLPNDFHPHVWYIGSMPSSFEATWLWRSAFADNRDPKVTEAEKTFFRQHLLELRERVKPLV